MKRNPQDIKRVDCVLRMGLHTFDVEIGQEEICHGSADSSAGAPVARTVHDNQVYPGAEGYGKLDAVRGLAYWLNECLGLNQDSFSVELPVVRKEFLKWR